MATKTKKKQAQVKAPVFNKVNAKAFAEMIFSDKGGVVTFLKLCEGSLVNGKEGGRTTHCAIGEAYHMFVNPNVKAVEVSSFENYESEYDGVQTDGSTAKAIDSLVAVAQLKNRQKKAELACALDHCVHSNDDGNCDGDSCSPTTDFLNRSEEVASTWLQEVVPLLK